LAFEALAREGRFLVENVSFYEALQTNHTKNAIPFPNLSPVSHIILTFVLFFFL
jgi:hypothetical protein